MKNAQEWLNKKFPLSQRNQVTEINNSYGEELKGNLLIKNFPNLQKISFSGNKKIASLSVSNCPQVKEIDIYGNEVSRLNIGELTGLESLILTSNNLERLDLSSNKELKTLICFNNPLKELKGLEKLNKLSYFNAGGTWKIVDGLNSLYENQIRELKKVHEKEIIELKEKIIQELQAKKEFSQVELTNQNEEITNLKKKISILNLRLN